MPEDRGIRDGSGWARLLAGLAGAYVLFQWSATALGSDRGQAGLLVGALVVGAVLAFERAFFSPTLAACVRAAGLGTPRAPGLLVAAGLGLVLLGVIPLYARATGASVTLAPDAVRIVPDLFAQAGIAEESLFRGYLFGHLRRGRTFRRAAVLSMVPFAAVHLYLYFTMPWPVATAALALAVVLSFPLAYLYELGGGTVWAPALLHFVVQGALKVIVVADGGGALLPLLWMGASAGLPMLCFLVPHGVGKGPFRSDASRP